MMDTQIQEQPRDEYFGYAGKFLKKYEWERYTLAEKSLVFADRWKIKRTITVPADAEQFGDVSFWQAGINWDIYATKARVAIIRIGQGAWKDSQFDFYYSEARRVGVALGGYWFYDDRSSPEQQASIIIASMQGKHFEKEIYVDWEVVYNGPYQGLKNVVKLMKLLEAGGLQVYGIGMYTGYYFFIEHSSWAMNAAEYNYLQYKALWLAWYAASTVVKVPPPWTESTWTDWQWGTPVWDWGQPTAEIDMNRSRYTTAEFENRYLGGDPPDEPEDVVTFPYDGVKRITGTRYGRAFYLVISDTNKVRFEVRHANKRDIPSNIAAQSGAEFVWNSGEWDRVTEMPKDLSISNGVTYVPRKTAVPSLFFLQNGYPGINHANIAGQWNVTSGLRYIVRDGQIPSYLYGNEPKYTDRTARSIEGLDNNGQVMRLTVDGVYGSPRQGVQLKEAAAIMIEFGATIAFDTGGGGDSCEIMNGKLMNVPEDISDGQNVERAVPEFLLAFAEEINMVNGEAQEALGNVAKIRVAPSRYATEVSTIPARGKTDFVAKVPTIPQGPADKDGETWLELPDGNFVNWQLRNSAGLLIDYFNILREPTEPTPGTDSVWVKGVVVDKDENGVETARYETDLVEAKKVS